MKGLLVTSTKMGAGKSSLCVGMGQKIASVGYFKPLGDRIRNGIDEDALLFKDTFELPEKVEELTFENDYHGILKDTSFRTDLRKELKRRYGRISRNHDLTFVESAHNLTYGSYANLCSSCIASFLKIKTLIVTEGSIEEIIDKLTFARAFFKLRKAQILGVIVNKLKDADRKDEIIAEIERLGLKCFGVMPHSPRLDTVTVGEIADYLDADILAGEEGLSNPVEHILVGALTLDSAIKALQRLAYENNALITGGDRSDIQLLAFESSTSCLVLTGNVFPSASVLAKADRSHIPVLLVPFDTVIAAEKVEKVSSKLKYGQREKFSTLERNVEKYVDLDGIMSGI